jgi:RNA polymerase sigma-70 factor (ECF subfamily)
VSALMSETGAEGKDLMEEELAARARVGDLAAFAQLVERHQTSVYNLCYRMLGDAAAAERVAHEVFVHALDRLSDGAPVRSIELWLLAIASQYCIDRLRETRLSRPRLNGRLPVDDVQPLLARLEPELRCVVVLRYWNALADDEIAEVTGDTVSVVSSRLHRARRALAQAVVEHEMRGDVAA